MTHSNKYVDMIENSFPKKGFSYLDGDTIVSPGSKEATFDAVGSIISAIDGIENKKFNNAFCAVRPPGHHSEQEKAMGFCIFNNVAVGANYLISKYKYKKIAIIDFDVHHGNGTQEIFYKDTSLLQKDYIKLGSLLTFFNSTLSDFGLSTSITDQLIDLCLECILK